MRKKLEGGKYTMLETRKDGTKFTNKPLREVADRLQGLSKQYESRQHQLVDEVSHPRWDRPVSNHPQTASLCLALRFVILSAAALQVQTAV